MALPSSFSWEKCTLDQGACWAASRAFSDAGPFLFELLHSRVYVAYVLTTYL